MKRRDLLRSFFVAAVVPEIEWLNVEIKPSKAATLELWREILETVRGSERFSKIYDADKIAAYLVTLEPKK